MDERAVAMMSGSELLSADDVLHDEGEEIKARQAHILNRLDQMGYAAEVGAHDTARLLTHRYRLDATEAHRRVHFATRLHKYPAVAAALATGDSDGVVLHMAQTEAIVSALDKIPARANVPVEDLAEAELRMVQAGEHLAPSGLRTLGVQVRNLLDTDGPEPRENAARQREEVWIKKTEDGVTFGGRFSGENAETLQTVLQGGAKPHNTETGEPDPRSRGKRQADALIDTLNLALDTGDLPARGGIKPHITVTIDLKDLLEAGKHATGDLAFGDRLSAAAIRRLACDAGIIPVVLGSNSQPLDVGREHRLVTPAIRNALNVRDRGCVVCAAPPIYCDAHHVTSWVDGGWVDGGETSLANMVLLCRVDHTSLHQGHWTITIENDQVQVTPPAWATRPSPGWHQKLATPSPAAPAHPAATDADTCPPPTEPMATTTCFSPADEATNATCPSPKVPSAEPAPSTSTPTRSWPHTNDVSWITPEETAALDPWPDEDEGIDTDTATVTRTRTRPTPHPSDFPRITPEETAPFAPWPDTA